MRKILATLIVILATHIDAHAAILWAGGEDIDFPIVDGAATWCSGGWYRSGFARTALRNCGTFGSFFKSNPFPGGAVTSLWFSARYNFGGCCGGGTNSVGPGVGKSGTQYGLFLGQSTTPNSASTIALYAYNGTSMVQLAYESNGSYYAGNVDKYDMQIINYGSAATVNVYHNGSSTPTLTYTGDVRAGTGNASLDSVFFSAATKDSWDVASEIIVANTDTRNLSVVTHAPNNSGQLSQWTGSYSNINPLWINDAVNIYDSTVGDVFNCRMNSLPTGNFGVYGIKLAGRALTTSGSPASMSLGVYTNSTQKVPTAVGLTGTWGTYETIYQTNPVTSSSWTPTDINNLQMNFTTGP